MSRTPAQRRALAIGCYLVALLALTALYAGVGRPVVEGPDHDAVWKWLSRLIGRRVAPRELVGTADRALLSAALLSTFVFAMWLRAADLIGRRAVLGMLLLFGAGIRLHLAFQDPVSIRRWPLDDDSHYYFNIAWNLAHGRGLRHDGFDTTTGVQPLFLLLITPVYWLIGSKVAAVNAILVLQTAIGVALGLALAELVRRVVGDAASLFAAAVWAFSRFFVSTDLNGLETGLSLLGVCCVCLVYLRMRDGPVPGHRRLVALGVWLGVAFWARTDNGLLGAALAVHMLASDPWGRPWRSRVEDVALVGAVAGLVALPWLVLNLALVGSLMPSGGQAVRFLSLAYGYRMMGATGPAFEPSQPPWEYYQATWLAAGTAIRRIAAQVIDFRPALLVAALGALLGVRPAWVALRRVGFLLSFLVLMALAYTFYVFGQWYFERYLAPFAIAYLLLLAAATWGGITWVATSARRRRIAEVTLAAGLAATLLADSVVVMSPRGRGSRGFYDAAQWINANTPESAVVGAFQTGIFGYYVERPFYGLDGKINIEALRALQTGRIDEYIREHRIEYLADWPFIFEDLLVARSRDPEFLSRQQQVYANRDVVIYQIANP